MERARYGTPTSPGFASLCAELSGAADGGRRSVAQNGAIIEQAQVITTHNLAVLFDALDLGGATRPRLALLARRCFQWICRRQQMKVADWRARLQMVKNTAYAWRQLVFCLSLAERAEVGAFLDWSAGYLAAQRVSFRRRFEPVLSGLRATAAGEQFDAQGLHAASGGRRFLGWSVGPHWLLPG